jgi:hypothetical protein
MIILVSNAMIEPAIIPNSPPNPVSVAASIKNYLRRNGVEVSNEVNRLIEAPTAMPGMQLPKATGELLETVRHAERCHSHRGFSPVIGERS